MKFIADLLKEKDVKYPKWSPNENDPIEVEKFLKE